MAENAKTPYDDVPPELGDGWFVVLTREELSEMPEPPTARAELQLLALVVSQWWVDEDADAVVTTEVTEIPPWEADLPTIDPDDLCEITIEAAHAPIRLTLLVFAGLSDEGGADPETLVYEISHRTSSTDANFSIAIESEATVLSIPKSTLPEQMAMAVLQAEWHAEPQPDGSPLVVSSTWAAYVGD